MQNLRQKPLALLIIIAGIVLLIASIIFALRSTRPQAVVPPSNNQEFNVPESNKIEVAPGTIVNNVYKDSVFNYPTGDVVYEDNEYYQLGFILSEKLFLISIYTKDFEEGRKLAETAFLAKLGITQQTACTLNTKIQTPREINPTLSNQTFGLSFCK